MVTVIFTDFKGFTAIAEKLSAEKLVTEINECFIAFDNIIQKYGIEKIKTIGDAYLAAGGLPTPKETHALDVVNAAREILEFTKDLKRKKGDLGFDIRIGIHSGPVVAGIVGVKKFAYDIWGDTVNTASRMESGGEAGKINISEATYHLVKDHFNCVFRGKIHAKGKGEIEMYFIDETNPKK
jgi:class 3 adenylate cyclase